MRLIDAKTLKNRILEIYPIDIGGEAVQKAVIRTVDEAPTIGGWISVKDDMPKEHPSIFAPYYGTEKWNSAMWRNESDRVLVAIRFPDGTCTVDKGRLQDGVWKTGVSPVLPQEVTHWAMWPEPPKEE